MLDLQEVAKWSSTKLFTLNLLYSLDQMPLLISRHSRIVAAPLEVLNEMHDIVVAALE